MAKKKRQKVRLNKTAEQVYVGTEPGEGTKLSKIDYMRALNVYNYFGGAVEARKYLKTYLTEVDFPEKKKLDKVRDTDISTVAGWIARMLSNGVEIPNVEKRKKWLVEQVEEMFAKAEEPNEMPAFARRAGIDWFAVLEDKVDEFVANGYKTDFVFSTWVEVNNPPAYVLDRISTRYKAEMDEILNVEKDPQVQEAYAKVPKKNREAFAAFLQTMVKTAATAVENKKRERKPRMPRVAPISKLVKGMKCKTVDEKTGVRGVQPEKIVGANQVIVYNTVDRGMRVFRVKEGERLSVKGSTLIGWDEKNSFGKIIGKPEKMIPELAGMGVRKFNKAFEEINKKPKPVTSGRVNDKCLILNVF